MHLTPADPAGVARFVEFLEGPCRRADRLVVVGDLFDVWVSDAQGLDRALAPALAALRALAGRTDVGFVEGNRDFAATPFLRGLGLRPLPDVVVEERGALRVVATHGDLLCRRDVRYQAYRRAARRSLARHLLRSVPPAGARLLGDAARRGSRMETSRKAYGDMGIDARAAASMLRARDADALVCGHVHWGQRFALEVDGRRRDVVVLGAWEDRPSYARLDADGLAFLAW